MWVNCSVVLVQQGLVGQGQVRSVYLLRSLRLHSLVAQVLFHCLIRQICPVDSQLLASILDHSLHKLLVVMGCYAQVLGVVEVMPCQ
jgi:hypothetical protein